MKEKKHIKEEKKNVRLSAVNHDLESSKDVGLHYGTNERGSERSERASERVSAAEGASEASSPEQANAVRAKERTDERVAQYFSLYS